MKVVVSLFIFPLACSTCAAFCFRPNGVPAPSLYVPTSVKANGARTPAFWACSTAKSSRTELSARGERLPRKISVLHTLIGSLAAATTFVKAPAAFADQGEAIQQPPPAAVFEERALSADAAEEEDDSDLSAYLDEEISDAEGELAPENVEGSPSSVVAG